MGFGVAGFLGGFYLGGCLRCRCVSIVGVVCVRRVRYIGS